MLRKSGRHGTKCGLLALPVCLAAALASHSWARQSATDKIKAQRAKPAMASSKSRATNNARFPGAASSNYLRAVIWPQAPLARDALSVKISEPILQSPRRDPLKSLNQKSPIQGVLAYIPRIKLDDDPVARHSIVMYGVGIPGSYRGKPTPVVSYRADAPYNENIGVPSFSPDGQWLLMKVGEYYGAFNGYKPYLWNLKSRQMRVLVNPEQSSLTFDRLQWSRDSQWLAYVTGGDQSGNEIHNTTLALWMYNVKTGKHHKVFTNPFVKSFAWSRDRLLFSVTPSRSRPRPTDSKSVSRHPSIYEAGVADPGNGNLLIQDAYNPVPSPDGQKIVFFGWPATLASDSNSASDGTPAPAPLQNFGLYVFDRATKERFYLGPHQAGEMAWAKDNKKLVLIEPIYGRERLGHCTLMVYLIETDTRRARLITVLEAQDFTFVDRIPTRLHFQLMGLVNNDKWILIKKSEFIGLEQSYYTEMQTMEALNVDTGRVETIAQVENKWGAAFGLSWIDRAALPAGSW